MRPSKILTSKAGVEMKTIKKIALILLLISALTALSGCVVTMPMPEIEEGRFDFSFTYEINGELKTYHGVYVCKLDGVHTTMLASGLDWDEYIENEKEIDIPIQTNEEGVVYINGGFVPEYFMGDPEFADVTPLIRAELWYSDEQINDIERIAEYGVKLIGYECDAPIKNTYK